MALDRVAAAVFETLQSRGLCRGSLLTLGRQQLALRPADLPAGLQLAASFSPDFEPDDFAEPLLRAIGFDRVESLDFSSYEGCDLVHDLNQPVPEAWHQRADVVFDGGTLEHVFHFPNAIANAMNLVKTDGCFITCTPYNGYPGHGFYQFSPDLFFRLFDKTNGFRVLLAALAETRRGGRMFKVEDPAILKHRISFSGRGPVMLVNVAERERAGAVLSSLPQQSDYEKVWSARRAIPLEGSENRSRPVIAAIKQWARHAVPKNLLSEYERLCIRIRNRKREREGVREVPAMAACWRI